MATFDLYQTLAGGLDIDEAARTVSVIPRLAPKDYARVKAILNRLGGDWSTKTQSFHFAKCPRALVDRVLATGSRRLNKFHLFPTPQEVWDFIERHTPVSYVGASAGTFRALEPSAGEGSLIRYLQAFVASEGREVVIDGYDIDPLNVLLCQEAGLPVVEADFLKVTPTPVYDLVFMNPPFNGDEFIKHIRHAQKFLSPTGVLVSVVPTAWLTSIHGKADRLWLLEQAQINSVPELSGEYFEPGTFAGTAVTTTVITLESAPTATRIFETDAYRDAAIASFCTHVDNSASLNNQLHKLKMRDLEADEALAAIHAIVDDVFARQDASTSHLVGRYRDDYVQALVAEWFPAYLYRLMPVAEPQQLKLIANW